MYAKKIPNRRFRDIDAMFSILFDGNTDTSILSMRNEHPYTWRVYRTAITKKAPIRFLRNLNRTVYIIIVTQYTPLRKIHKYQIHVDTTKQCETIKVCTESV